MARVYKLTIKCHYADGTLLEPGWHYQTDVGLGGDEPDPDDVADAIKSHIETPFAAIVPAAVHITSFDVREMVVPPAIGVLGTALRDTAGNGANGDLALPFGISAIIQAKTATASRNARGYMAAPGPLNSAELDAGKFSSTKMTLYNALADVLNDDLSVGSVNPTGINPVAYSRTRHLGGLSPYTFKVTSAVVSSTPHWRRSRMTNP